MFFTYLFGWSKLDRYYYGVRYKDEVTFESVGTTYLSSSAYVLKFIEEHGMPDIVEIRKIFDSKHEAKSWETRVLSKLGVPNNPKFLNRSNNNCFKNTVMDEEIKRKISKANTGKFVGYTTYNNGAEEKRFPPSQQIPEGWVKGIIKTPARLRHIERMKSGDFLSKETRAAAAQKNAAKTKGKKKPLTHGKNVSKALTGIKRPNKTGLNNVSNRPDVKEKISRKLKGRKFFHKDGHLIFVLPENAPKDYVLGKPKHAKTDAV